MEYLCILNAFEQNYYNRLKEIERIAACASAAAAVTTATTSMATTTQKHAALTTTTQAQALNMATTSSGTSNASSSSSPTTSTFHRKMHSIMQQQQHHHQQQQQQQQQHQHMPQLAHAAAIAATQQHIQQWQQQQHNNESLHFHYQQHQQQQQFASAQQQQHNATQGLSLYHHQQQQQHYHHHHHHHQQQQQQPNSSVVNSLLWQPWRDLQQAAAIHHQLYQQQQQQQQQHQLQKEGRPTSKELPTTKWRRDRRQRIAAEYNVHEGSTMLQAATSQSNDNNSMDCPLDMSVSSSTARHHQNSPPPPYREPLPGSSYHATTRPSVITQAPPKRELNESLSSASRELDNRSEDSISMCETAIDEHFRRSLGANYAVLFGKKSPTPNSPVPSTPSPQPALAMPPTSGAPAAVTPPVHLPILPKYNAGVHMSHHQHSVTLPMMTITASAPIKTLKSPPHVAQLRGTSVSPQPDLPPPQSEPLSLHRESTPPPPEVTTAVAALASPQQPPPPSLPIVAAELPLTVKLEAVQQRTTHSPPITGTPPLSLTMPPAAHSARSTPVPTMPAILRIKAEPGLVESANTPPASPTSSTASNAPVLHNSDGLASVDDHFAKALGDTWKKLQGNKDLQK